MHSPNNQRRFAFGMALMAVLTAGCREPVSPLYAVPASPAATANQVSPPSLVGTLPAGPSREAPASTSGAPSDVSKAQQSTAMPMPGQANDHSTPSPVSSRKANSTGATP